MDNESGEFIEGDEEPGEGRSECEVENKEIRAGLLRMYRVGQKTGPF